ncbi:MAG: lanthionine synthetase LanC family protein, partial [Bacteroidota bacterium]
AHGLSGVLLVLIGIYANGIKEKNIVDIVETGIKYILSFKREIDFYVENFAMFPEKVKLNHEVEFSNQLTWAASDLNQAILLYKAHDLLKYKDLPKIADLIGLNTLIRQEEKSTQIVSSNFYDGAAGVAQSYRNLYVLSKHQAYWEGYKFWIEKTVFFLDKEIQDKKNLNPKLNLLNGIPGVGLTLLSFVSKEELFWNKYFFA